MRKLCSALIAIFLSACSVLPPLTPDPSERIVFQPTPTPTMIPSPTSTAAPATVSPEPTLDPLFFRDDFTKVLDPQWSWVREDPAGWNLTQQPGFLEITVEGGYVAAHTNVNMLLRPAPEGDFQIETQISFRPLRNFQFAGLIIYESDSNFIQAGRGFCSSVDCIGEGLYMNHYKKGVVVKPDFGQLYRDIDPIQIRLSRRGTTYTFEVSTDGKVWFMIGSHTSDMTPTLVGLTTGQRLNGPAVPAAFDYFEVHSLPD